MLKFIPSRMKSLVPGYRQRHYRRHAALIDAIGAAMKHLTLGSDGAVPWLDAHDEQVRLHGFATEPANGELYDLLRPALPRALPRTHFRLVKDYVTRWLHPHMRPDLHPDGYGPERLFGFHGQHRDDISAIADPAARARLLRAFKPGPADIVVDCGAYLGFGAIRMGRDAPQGRVFAIEASSACAALLRRNVEANAANNVVPLHRGVWNLVGEMNLETNFAQANSLVAEVQEGAGRETVRTISIDALVKDYALQRLDMISLTLNGAEVEAVAGAVESLVRLRPRLRAAGWYKREGRRIADLIGPLIARADYDVFVGPHGNVMALPRERK